MKKIRAFFYKNTLKHTFGLFILCAFLITLINSCDKNNDIGFHILPADDSLVIKYDSIPLKAFTVHDRKVQTGRASYALVGAFNHHIYGRTTTTSILQYGTPTTIPIKSSVKSINSVTLHLKVRADTIAFSYFPKRTSTHQLTIYEVNKTLNDSDTYYTDMPPTDFYDPTSILGTTDFTADVANMSDTSIIKIELPVEFGENLLNLDSATYTVLDTFTQIFKGLVIESTPQDDRGSIICFEYFTDLTKLSVSYKNTEDQDKIIDFVVSENSIRMNLFEHDFTASQDDYFKQTLNDTINAQDSIVYMSGLIGTVVKITVDDDKINEYSNVIVNNAMLKIPKHDFDTTIYTPTLKNMIIINGNYQGLEEYYYNNSYIDRILSEETNCWEFNISQQMHQILNKNGVSSFYLLPSSRTQNPAGTILKSGTNKNGMKLYLTYTIIK